MPTTDVVNVNTDGGGDYSTLNAAIVGEARNLTTLDEILEIRVAGSTVDTTAVPAASWASYVCSATNKIRIVPASGYGATGIWNTSKYRLETTNASCIGLPTTASVLFNIEIDNIQLRTIATTGSSARRCINGAAGVTVNSPMSFTRCLMRVTKTGGTSTVHTAIQISDTNLHPTYFGNNVCIMEGADVGVAIDRNASINFFLHNNTVICVGTGTNYAFNNTGGATNTFQLINNAVFGFSTWLLSGPNYDNSNYNSTDLSAATGGANDRVSQTATFVDSANGNYQPASSDAALKGFGTNLSGDANLPITLDIAGNTRSSPYDIGAFIAATGGGGGGSGIKASRHFISMYNRLPRL